MIRMLFEGKFSYGFKREQILIQWLTEYEKYFAINSLKRISRSYWIRSRFEVIDLSRYFFRKPLHTFREAR